jgi:hypothetical protein
MSQTKAEPDLSAEIALSPSSGQQGTARCAGQVGQCGMTAASFPTDHEAMVSAECEQARLNR